MVSISQGFAELTTLKSVVRWRLLLRVGEMNRRGLCPFKFVAAYLVVILSTAIAHGPKFGWADKLYCNLLTCRLYRPAQLYARTAPGESEVSFFSKRRHPLPANKKLDSTGTPSILWN